MNSFFTSESIYNNFIMQNEEFLTGLKKKNERILKDLSRLKLIMPKTDLTLKLVTVFERFEKLGQNWEKFVENTEKRIQSAKKAQKRLRKHLETEKMIFKELGKERRRVRSQEIVIESCERFGRKSLGKVRGMWRKSLDNMEISVKSQSDVLVRVSCNGSLSIENLDIEFEQVFESPAKIQFSIEKVNKGHVFRGRKLVQEEVLGSNPFIYFSEDIASFRNYSSSAQASFKRDKNEVTPVKAKISLENETLSDSVNLQEVKKALFVLKKANLLDNGGNQTLMQIADLIKSSESSSNFELVLQLMDIENRKNDKSGVKSIKKRQKQRPKNIFKHPQCENFEFSIDESLTKGLLLADCEFFSSEERKDELKDVKLEDLLEVAPMMEDLGLISADNSVINELNQGVLFTDEETKDKENFQFPKDFPASFNSQ